MEVRRARPDEYEVIGKITVDAYRDLPGSVALGDYEEELADVARRAVECTVLVGADGDSIVGTVTYVPGPNTAMSEFDDADAAGIRMLAVCPDRQGQGVGKALTDACIELARADGWAKIVLHSTEVMKVARAMYERAGFVAAPDRDVLITQHPHSAESPFRLIAYVLTL